MTKKGREKGMEGDDLEAIAGLGIGLELGFPMGLSYLLLLGCRGFR